MESPGERQEHTEHTVPRLGEGSQARSAGQRSGAVGGCRELRQSPSVQYPERGCSQAEQCPVGALRPGGVGALPLLALAELEGEVPIRQIPQQTAELVGGRGSSDHDLQRGTGRLLLGEELADQLEYDVPKLRLEDLDDSSGAR